MSIVHVLFGTESGNAQSLAQRAGEALASAGVDHRVLDMQDVDCGALASVRVLVIITSTYGNGDPPSNAEVVHAHLMKKAPPFERLSFAVFGLGDTTYERFAQCGKDFDKRLEELGGTRLLDRVDADVDYEGPFEGWLERALPLLSACAASAKSAPAESALRSSGGGASDPIGTRRHPVAARVIENRNLNGPDSDKATHHLALTIEELPAYEPGDSIGVWPDNDPGLVQAILERTKLSGDAEVVLAGERSSLREALTSKLEIQEPDARLCEHVLGSKHGEELSRALREQHVIDLLERATGEISADELVHKLRPMAPRLYSIASSPRVHPGEVHLLVDILRYELGGRARQGVTSRLVSQACKPGDRLRLYLHPTPTFRLPAPEVDVIMIGPGTGVAPFRAFLEERRHQGARGRAWLFFGARRRATDFVYQRELEAWLADGTLTHLSTAFSRDQADKIYVQHRMLEAQSELAAWIDAGAHLYVCGDAKRMAPDVERALLQILARDGRRTLEQARVELSALASQGRYVKDVY